jgi:flagellar biosynthesis protein FliQ
MITDKELGRGMLVLNIIWCTMLVSLVIYLFVGLQVASNVHTSVNEDSYTVFKSVLYVLTCLILIATWYLRKFFLSRKIQPVQAAQVLDHPALQRYFVASIIAWALSEGIGIFGFILFLLGRNTTDLYILILIAAIAMFLYRPRKEDIISMAEEHQESSATGGATA